MSRKVVFTHAWSPDLKLRTEQVRTKTRVNRKKAESQPILIENRFRFRKLCSFFNQVSNKLWCYSIEIDNYYIVTLVPRFLSSHVYILTPFDLSTLVNAWPVKFSQSPTSFAAVPTVRTSSSLLSRNCCVSIKAGELSCVMYSSVK
jgi:hypothetical protein